LTGAVLPTTPLLSVFARVKILALSTAVLMACTMCLAAEPIVVGVISADSAGQGKQAWDPVFEQWSQAAGTPYKGYYANTYAGVYAAAVDGRVHLARMSPRLALDAIATGKWEVFAQQAWSDGTVGYRSQLIVRADSPIRSLSYVFATPGKYRLGHGERQSTSGYVLPQQLFARNKISIPLHFTAMVEGSHQSSILAVANREVDIAAVNSSRMVKFAQLFPEEAKQLRVIWESEPIPDVMWLMRSDLPEASKALVRKTVLGFGKGARGKAELAVLRKIYDLKGFVSATNASLLPMLEWSRLADRNSAELDAGSNEAERSRRMGQIDRMYSEMALALGIR
jgi:phosphonate transport system substrate-binding protein